MCTMGAYSDNDTLLFKTLDFTETSFSVARITDDGLLRVLGVSLPVQRGLNCGLNEYGLAISMCYYGTESNETVEHDWNYEDVRGLHNLRTLQRARSVPEGVEMLIECFKRESSRVGGIHFLTDQTGVVGLVEHLEGKILYKIFPGSSPTFLGSANTSNLGIGNETENLSTLSIQDRKQRLNRLEKALQSIVPFTEVPIETIKATLSYHSDNENEIGSICIHNHDVFGSRANLSGSMSTITSVILDVKQLKLYYSTSYPCEGDWKSIAFEERE